MDTLKRLNELINKKNKTLYIFSIVLTVFSTFFSLLVPLIIKFVVDSILDNKPLDVPVFIKNAIDWVGGVPYLSKHIWIPGAFIILVTIINGILTFLKDRFSVYASENTIKTLKDKLYDHIQKLPYMYHSNSQAGDLIQRCTSDVETVKKFIQSQMMEVFKTLFMLILSMTIMFSLNVKLAFFSIIMIPIIFVYSYIFSSKVKIAFKNSDEKEGALSTVLQENLSGVRVVRAFCRQEFEMQKFLEKNKDYRDTTYNLIKIIARFWSTSDLICFTQIMFVLIASIYMIYNNEITLGTLLLFSTYENMLIWPARQLGRIISDFGKMQVSLFRIDEILDLEIEVETENGLKPDLNGDIVFSNVSFRYEEDKQSLKNVSFVANKGDTIALLGTTGSGKSTLMHLLLRLYDYTTGSIKINGIELNTIDKKWLREKIGIVLQEPFLFSKSIKENIKMASDNVLDKDIFQVTKIALIHSTIEDFEKGYDTIVGEKGVTLSGGQKQRVAIARTLIKDSSILIFDDSLSAVDTETDSQIRSALKSTNKNIITFIISQRISTLKEADKILVLEDGQITNMGTHDELISKDGLYSRIWKIQNMLEDDFDIEVK